MQSSLLDCTLSVLAFYKTAAGLRVNAPPDERILLCGFCQNDTGVVVLVKLITSRWMVQIFIKEILLMFM